MSYHFEQGPKGFKFVLVASLVVGIAYAYHSKQTQIPIEPIDQQLESIDYSTYGGPRSGDWMQVRTDYVRKHPRCEACGSIANLNVHHVIPFHQRPDLELDEGNLITLCREHHFRIGHDPDGKGPLKPSWLLSNPNVRSDAAAWKSRK